MIPTTVGTRVYFKPGTRLYQGHCRTGIVERVGTIREVLAPAEPPSDAWKAEDFAGVLQEWAVEATVLLVRTDRGFAVAHPNWVEPASTSGAGD